jgi:DNA-binding NarL/FixJ family response regulator
MLPHPSRVVIVDDFRHWRESVRLILQDYERVQVVAEVADGLQAVEEVRRLRPELVLLDIGLPSLNGIEAAVRILQHTSATRIVFLTASNHAAIVSRSLETGAQGYVLKTDASKELWSAIEAVLCGNRFVSSGVRLNSPEYPPKAAD